MSQNLSNPASRLYYVLEQISEYPNINNAKSCWSEILGTSDDVELHQRYALVVKQIHKTHELLCASKGGDARHYLNWYPEIKGIFATGKPLGDLTGLKNKISSRVLSDLHMCSDYLNASQPEPEQLSSNQLSKIKSDAENLIEEVNKSELSDELKKFIQATLKKIILAVDEYIFAGATSLSTAVKEAFGYAVMHPSEIKQAEKDSIHRKFWASIYHTATILTIVTCSLQLPANLQSVVDKLEQTSIEEEVISTEEFHGEVIDSIAVSEA